MFDLRRFFHFWRRFLGLHGFILGVILFFAFFTEFITQSAPVMSFGFWVSVGLDVVPAIMVGLMVLWLVSRFMQATYGLDSNWQGLQFLFRSRFGKPKFGPFLKIDQGQILPTATNVLTRVGGRGSLIVANTSAVVLEKRGQLTRIEGAGYFDLDRFEKVYDAIDLQPKHWTPQVKAMTLEGIPIIWEVEVQFKIADGDRPPNDKIPYPFLKEAVFQAVTSKRKRLVEGRVELVDWEKLVLLYTEEALRAVLANYSLDQLIGLTTDKIQPAREAIQNELTQILSEKVRNLGVKILGIRLNTLQVNDPVTQQWINEWQTRWQQVLNSLPVNTNGTPLAEIAKSEAWRLLHTAFYREVEKQDPSQSIKFMALIHFFFNLERRIRAEAASQLFMPEQILGTPASGQSEASLNVDSGSTIVKPLREGEPNVRKSEVRLKEPE